MLNRIYACLAFAWIFIMAIVMIFYKGKQIGKQQAKAKANEQTLEQIQDVQNRINRAGDINSDDVHNSLRKGDF